VSIILRAAETLTEFDQLAAWFNTLEDEVSTGPGLQAYFEAQRERITLKVAEDEHKPGELLGFTWIARDKLQADRARFYLYVKPEQRQQGLGQFLYEDLLRTAQQAQLRQLHVALWDHSPEDRAYAERRGFTERLHEFAMTLDLRAFDDQPYDALLTRLEGEGFQFTSMAELGDTEAARRQLYLLNEATSMDIPGAGGEPSWASFEDFQSSVCQASWYLPAGQKVVIDSVAGTWAAMSAITRFEGATYAYNLHTGVARAYRGQKLGQAVKITALRFAREVLHMDEVRTHHNAKNTPIIAIDRKFGYQQLPGIFLMEKLLNFRQD
jgi:GNAT superfamily N-acetyltransferase